MAGKVYLDMHIHVPSHASVSEGHYLGDLVAYTIKKAHSQVEDVMIHIDTDEKIQTDSFLHESTSDKPPHLKLPARHQIMADLGFLLRTHSDYLDIPNTRLHYLNNHLEIEIIARAEKAPEGVDLKRLTAGILLDLQTANYVQKTAVLWQFDS